MFTELFGVRYLCNAGIVALSMEFFFSSMAAQEAQEAVDKEVGEKNFL
jgi:hypothetical protein